MENKITISPLIKKIIDISMILVIICVILFSIFAFSDVERTKKILSDINNKHDNRLCGLAYERNYLHQFSDDCLNVCKGYLGRCPKNVTGNFSFINMQGISNCYCDGVQITNPTWYVQKQYEFSYNESLI